MTRALVVIPARLASTRLPRKLLLAETGRPLVQHVWERATRVRGAARVVVAVDDPALADAARGFGADVVETSPDHPSGTDRVAEVVRHLVAQGEVHPLVVNVQGDEPELEPDDVDALIDLMAEAPTADLGTLAEPLDDPDELQRPQVVKVVCDARGFALYFSRSPIPSPAGDPPEPGRPLAWRHVGLYAYRPAALAALCALPPAPLERRERLEQLRALYNGLSIRVGRAPARGARGIDTPEDYARFVERWRRGLVAP